MHALHAYAPNDPGQLRYETAPEPELSPGDVLVRVHASGVTPSELAWPTTWLAPDSTARPLPIIPGHELSGVVEAVTPGTNVFRVGDAVYGLVDFQRNGSDAELVAARASELAHKPSSIDHIEAAAVPLSALTAWQALFDHAALTPGQRILVHGASGGVGLFAIQFAHHARAHVIASAASQHAARLRELGADEVIDYHTTRFEEVTSELDVVFDTVGGETWERSWVPLRAGGKLVSVAVPKPPDTPRRTDAQAIWFVVESRPDQLTEISRLLDDGAIRAVVAEAIPLRDSASAYGRHPGGSGLGKIVIDVAGEAAATP